MGWYTRHVLPQFTDLLRGREFSLIRSRVVVGLEGEVLEIGFGSGLNVAHYPAGLSRVLAVDPAVAGRKLAARRRQRAGSRSTTSAWTGRRCRWPTPASTTP